MEIVLWGIALMLAVVAIYAIAITVIQIRTANKMIKIMKDTLDGPVKRAKELYDPKWLDKHERELDEWKKELEQRRKERGY